MPELSVAPLRGRVQRLRWLLGRLHPVPEDWVKGRAGKSVKDGGLHLECLPCKDWVTLRNAWRKAMKWIEGLDRALSVMLASVLSTESVGDQLWVKIIGPPSCGKTVLCEAISTNRQFVVAKSTIRGFHSGFKTDKDGSEDNSLLATLYGKTLVTKDGDTLLQAPNLPQILSEARDIYDRVSRTHYRNKMSKDYDGVSMTWILCGTESLRSLDSSELGERLLDCVIMSMMDPELEDSIGLQVAYRADRELSIKADGTAKGRDNGEMVLAKQLTGGYVQYLRENAQRLLDRVTFPEHHLRMCVSLGTFVAFMRSRPSKKQDEAVQRELSFRLISQIVRLAKCLAVVLNKSQVDAEVMRRTTLVATDTSRGKTLDIAKFVQGFGRRGIHPNAVATMLGEEDEKVGQMIKFMRRIGVLELYETGAKAGTGVIRKLRLTDRLDKLYRAVMVGAEAT